MPSPTKTKKEESTEKVFSSKTIEKFNSLGFTPVVKPGKEPPRMVTAISGMALNALGDFIAKYTAWREYTEDLHARAVAVWCEKQESYKQLYDITVKKMNGANITERKTLASSEPNVILKANEVLEAEMMKDLLGSRLESFTNVLTMLSRELSRRGQNPYDRTT